MLVSFKVGNYRSIGEEQIISLIPAKGQTEYRDNVYTIGKHSALNALVLYGANSSGKSNILKAIELLDRLLYLSARSNSTTALPYDPNLLIDGFVGKPTTFEVTFVIDKSRYRYGVSFDINKVQHEWLYRKGIGREVELFYREDELIQVSTGFDRRTRIIDAAIEATRENALFLSTCDIFNISEAKKIFGWFDQLISVDGLDTTREEVNTINLFENNEKYRFRINEYLRQLDLGLEGVELVKSELNPLDIPKDIDSSIRARMIEERNLGKQVNAIHKTYSQTGEEKKTTKAWLLEERESAGTKKAFQLSGPVIYTLINGGVLVIDEIEAKLHTTLTKEIVDLFLNKETNPKKAQLLMATHDTNLLKYSRFRRDQINFVEKNARQETEVYSLSDFRYFKGNKERPDTDKEKRYLEGRYGAVPKVQVDEKLLEML